MEMVTLEDVCEVIAGQSPPSENYNQEGKGLPFFQGKADFNDLYPSVKYWCDKPTKIALPNDVLLSVRAPVGPTNLCNEKSCIGRGLSAIRAGKKVDHKYLLYFFRSIEEKLSSQGRGSTFSAITQSEIKEIKFPLIDLHKQQKIASILEQADAARQKRKQANQLTEQFLQSAFLEMFQDYLLKKKSCEWKPTKEATDFIDYRGKTPNKSESGVILLTAKNVKKGFIEEEPKEFILESEYSGWMTRGFPNEGNILFTTEAPLANVAKLGKYEKVVIGQRIITMQCKKEILPDYLMYCLLSDVIQVEIHKLSTGSTAKGIRSKEFEKIRIPIPPLPVQQKFASIVEQIEQLRVKQRESGKELENLFGSLMQRYFG